MNRNQQGMLEYVHELSESLSQLYLEVNDESFDLIKTVEEILA